MREALQDSPEQVQEFVSLLGEFEQAGDGQEVTGLFRKLRCILGEHTDLLRDFAAFLHPEQALQCGLVSACSTAVPPTEGSAETESGRNEEI